MKSWHSLFLVFALLPLAACRSKVPACQGAAGTPVYLTVPPGELPAPTPRADPAPITIDIAGKPVSVDKVVEGPLCNDTWSGTVYVSCNVQVYKWTLAPDFLSKCNLNIKPGTVVYVAYHNNTPYYNGCSCHTMTGTNP